ncbi:hypothetical protein [Pantoea ananatis]|uniref:hypothetical protein n=1 Tax=Pantoea ananas TaxID=553 RepID=UPI001EE546F3|nr:hypothetical protein [Pantoea ananatis]
MTYGQYHYSFNKIQRVTSCRHGNNNEKRQKKAATVLKNNVCGESFFLPGTALGAE